MNTTRRQIFTYFDAIEVKRSDNLIYILISHSIAFPCGTKKGSPTFFLSHTAHIFLRNDKNCPVHMSYVTHSHHDHV